MPLYIDENKCTSCESCVPICPLEAISIINNKTVIDQNKCEECLLCMDECQAHAIYQILEKEDSVIQRKEFIPKPVNFNVPQPTPSSWPHLRKQQTTGTVAMFFLSGITKLTSNFLKEKFFQSRRKEGRGKQVKHRRRHGRW